MAKAWNWVSEHVAAILAVVAAVLGAGIVWQYHKRTVGSLQDLLAVEKAQERIAGLRAQREVLAETAAHKKDDIARLDAAIVENKRAIVAAHERAEKMNTDEILEAFDRLGYK